MKIRMIVAQYPERYAGEYMPNIVDAWDEYVMDDNPEGFNDALKKHEALVASGDYEAVRVLDVEVPDSAVLGLFQIPTVKGIASV